MLQAGRPRDRDPIKKFHFVSVPKPSDHTRPWGVERGLCEADSSTSTFEPIA
jgi:hypothetical protein